MAERLIIDKEKYKKLKALISSKDDETSNLAITLIDQCNIEESMDYIIPLINAGYDFKITGASKVFKSKRVFDYISDILGSVQEIPTMHDLNWLISLYHVYCTIKGRPIVDARHIKFITTEYNERVTKNPLTQEECYEKGKNDFKLNPKKNVKRKN